MFNKIKKSKKGFTLVEVIVVLVILAILAAIMIPSMTGWIDKAKNQSILVEARTGLLAAQTIASEQYAKDPAAIITYMQGDTAKTAINTLAGFTGSKTVGSVVCDAKATIQSMTYTDGSKTATYAIATGWTV